MNAGIGYSASFFAGAKEIKPAQNTTVAYDEWLFIWPFL
jgi:hypothetical protein